MNSFSVPFSFSISFWLLVGLFIAQWIYRVFIVDCVRQARQNAQDAKQQDRISKAFEENNGSAAWDATIDMQLDKLRKGQLYETRKAALQYIQRDLEQQQAILTREQSCRLVQLLPYQKKSDVLYQAICLLCRSKESLKYKYEDEVDKTASEKELDNENSLCQGLQCWKPAFEMWFVEILIFTAIWERLNLLPVGWLTVAAVVAFILAGLPMLKVLPHWKNRLVSLLVIAALISGGFGAFAETMHGRYSETPLTSPFSDYGSDLKLQIRYPEWLTADDLDVNNNKGKQITLTVEKGDTFDVCFEYDANVIHIRDKDGGFDPFPITIKGDDRKIELYVQAADKSVLSGATTVITPSICNQGLTPLAVTEETPLPRIRLEPTIWRTFRNVSLLITGASGSGGVLVSLVPFLSKILQKREDD